MMTGGLTPEKGLDFPLVLLYYTHGWWMYRTDFFLLPRRSVCLLRRRM